MSIGMQVPTHDAACKASPNLIWHACKLALRTLFSELCFQIIKSVAQTIKPISYGPMGHTCDSLTMLWLKLTSLVSEGRLELKA